MVPVIYQIKSVQTADIIHFKEFLKNYTPKISFKEFKEDGVISFKLNFIDNDERNKFNNDFREITGLSPFVD